MAVSIYPLEVDDEYEFFDGTTPPRDDGVALPTSTDIPYRSQAAQCDRRNARLRQAHRRNRRRPFRRRAVARQDSYRRQRLAIVAQRWGNHYKRAAGDADRRWRINRSDLSGNASRAKGSHGPARPRRERESVRILHAGHTVLRDVFREIWLAQPHRLRGLRTSPGRRSHLSGFRDPLMA